MLREDMMKKKGMSDVTLVLVVSAAVILVVAFILIILGSNTGKTVGTYAKKCNGECTTAANCPVHRRVVGTNECTNNPVNNVCCFEDVYS